MRLAQIAASALLVTALCGCQKQKETIFIDSWWNRDYAMNACYSYKQNAGVACINTPEQMAAELRSRFASAVLQTPTCKDVTISYDTFGGYKPNPQGGWSLSFNVAIDGGEIDYSNSDWQIIDIKTNRRFSKGSLKDAVEAARRVCTVVTGRGGSVAND
jgi:hypothetical protein